MTLLKATALVCLVLLITCNAAWAKDVDPCMEGASLLRSASNFDKAISLLSECIKSGKTNKSQRKKAYVSRGHAWLQKMQKGRAMADFNKALELDPKWPAAYLGRAFVWKLERKLNEAIADYSKAIELDPWSYKAYRDRGLVWESKKQYDKAISDFSKAIKLRPQKIENYLSRGNAWQNKGECRKAAADYHRAFSFCLGCDRVSKELTRVLASCSKSTYQDGEQAVVPYRKRARYYDALAAVYAKAGRREDAIKAQEQAIARAQKEGMKHIADFEDRLAAYKGRKPPARRAKAPDSCQKGTRALHRYKLDEAINLFSKCIKSGNQGRYSLALAHANRGRAFAYKRQYDKAIEDVDKAIQLNPTSAGNYSFRGNLWSQKKQYDKAIADNGKAIEIYAKDVTRLTFGAKSKLHKEYIHRANNWANKGEYGKAITDYNKALELDPKNTDAYSNRASVWARKGQYDKAIADLGKVIELYPKSARSYIKRGQLWNHTKQYDKAIADYSKAVEIEPRYVIAYYYRAKAWYGKGRYGKAIADSEKVIRLQPKAPTPYADLAWLLATCSDAKYRNGARAVTLAEKAIQLKRNSRFLVVLATAYAEAGDFKKAVRTQEQAIALAKKEGRKNLAQYERFLASFRQKKPWREKQKPAG